MTLSKFSNYKDRYGQNGCDIRINVCTQEQWGRISGPAIKTKIFGLKMAKLFIVATVITENPEVPALEQKINDIIRSAAVAATFEADMEVEGTGRKSTRGGSDTN